MTSLGPGDTLGCSGCGGNLTHHLGSDLAKIHGIQEFQDRAGKARAVPEAEHPGGRDVLGDELL